MFDVLVCKVGFRNGVVIQVTSRSAMLKALKRICCFILKYIISLI